MSGIADRDRFAQSGLPRWWREITGNLGTDELPDGCCCIMASANASFGVTFVEHPAEVVSIDVRSDVPLYGEFHTVRSVSGNSTKIWVGFR